MYAKLVVYEEGDPILAGSGDSKVVPRRHVIIEGDRFEYRKYLGPNLKTILEANGLVGEIMGGDHSNSPRPYELIHLMAWKRGVELPDQYIAPLHQLYIMNDSGKTVDTMSCLIQESK